MSSAPPSLIDPLRALPLGRTGPWLVTADGPPLAGMASPETSLDHDILGQLGIDVAISLIGEPEYDTGAFEVDVFSLQDLHGGTVPADAQGEQRLVLEAAQRVIERMRAGNGVVVHCAAGVGRTGTVVGAALVGLGHSDTTVTAWLDTVQRLRGFPGWPESPWQLQALTAVAEQCPRRDWYALQGPEG